MGTATRILVALAAFLMIVAPASGQSSTPFVEDGFSYVTTATPVEDVRITIDMEAATAYWGRAPACTVKWYAMTVTQVGPSTSIPAVARADAATCSAWVDTTAVQDWTMRALCPTVVHEIGHILGHGHTEDVGQAADDPVNVMAIHPLTEPEPCTHLGDLVTIHLASSRKRNRHNANDRRWCRKHSRLCRVRYPRLAKSVLRR
jgi:hypothetical protein